jgi:hypothetical protein
MKKLMTLSTIFLAAAQAGYAQGFINLNFETATISGGTATVPGWKVNTFNYVNGDTNSIPYNNIALDSPSVNLEGTDSPIPSVWAIQGNYSIFIQGGSRFSPDTNGASIWQTGQILAGSQSLTWWGDSMNVSFGGQSLSIMVLGSTPNYTIYGADISAFAGQTGQLVFSVPWQTSSMLDNIQFSSSPVPEPSTFALTALGGLLLGFRRWKT